MGVFRTFFGQATVDLFDEDSPDPDDHLGGIIISSSEAGLGQRVQAFAGDDAHWTILYKFGNSGLTAQPEALSHPPGFREASERVPGRNHMRRHATSLVALLAAGLLGIGGAAQAACGELIINDAMYANPSGCYQIGSPGEVRNGTDELVFLFHDDHCEGMLINVVVPGEEVVAMPGTSLFIR
ncbi:hypothetical protein [Streptomyces syringium]|uniref:hypothetical protein n=1 Tax=Streptomyces syringium TaxID=76729 RepID=UPI0033DA70F9